MAWQLLEPILRRAGFAHDAPQLLAPLRRAADAGDRPGRDRALNAAAAALAANGHAAALLRALAGADEPTARRLALELAARLPASPDSALLDDLRPLLRDRRIPTAVRLAATAALARAADPKAAERVLRAFAGGFGKARFLERLPELRQRFGPLPALERYAVRLRARLPLRCPRCRARLPQPAMVRHLWEEHRLMLDGRRARSPWRQVNRWIAEHAASGADEPLGRGLALVQQIDPAHGLLHIDRQLLRRGLRDDDSLARLRAEAARRRAGLCPHCFAPVPLDPTKFPAPDDLRPLNGAHGRLSGHGFVVEVSERGLVPMLWVETPRGLGFYCPEPGRRLTPRGVKWVVISPLVLFAVVLAVGLPPVWALPGTLLTLATALWVAVRWRAPQPDDLPGRAIDHAWRRLVPHLHANGFDTEAAGFIAGLALSSLGRGTPRARERLLRRLIPRTRAALQEGTARPADLAALHCLQIEDAPVTGSDAVRLLADAVQPCLTGELPLACAELLLAEEPQAGWTRGERARLRVLLAARAFAAGLDVWDLHEMGRAAPGLGRALESDDTDGLARLRLLWDLRPTRPWQRCGPAATVFELANYPMLGSQHLEAAPDLLLFQPLPSGGETHALLACGRGLIYRGALIHAWPVAIALRPLPLSKGGGDELRLGPHVLQIAEGAEVLAPKLEAWADYFFNEFLARIGEVLARPTTGMLDRLLDPLTVRCLECGTAFLGRVGDVGGEIKS
jgi:hypothetical protein